MEEWLWLLAGHVLLISVSLVFLSQAPLREGRSLRWPTRAELTPLLPAFLLILAVVVVHLIEVRVDAWFTQRWGVDLTPQVFAVEGTAVATFQHLGAHPLLENVALAVYIFGYPFLIYFTPVFLALHRDLRGLTLFALSFAALYALALPFYLFFPVQDPWLASALPWYHGPSIQFQLQERWPSIVPMYWQLTTPNNVIPSMHAGLSALCAIVAWRSGHKRFAMLAAFFALTIPPASFFVGVHWLMDPLIAYAMVSVAVAFGVKSTPSFMAWTEQKRTKRAQRVAGPVVAAEVELLASFGARKK